MQNLKPLMRLSILWLATFIASACVAHPSAIVSTQNFTSLTPSAIPSLTATSPPGPSAIPTFISIPTDTPTPAPVHADQNWWREAVFYEIFVRSFYDANGDGIGDFNGLRAKLDYLNDGDPASKTDLGVTALWLMPIFPSPSTHGYDVTDFYAANPQYGTLAEFRALVAECHRRGIRVIIDLPLNHTSNQHPWFIQSQNPQSPYRDWYRWSVTDPGYPGPWGPNHVVWHKGSSGYYYGLFSEGMPDLNYTNPAVTAEMYRVARFWLEEVGIDGFRLDAAGALIEEDRTFLETAVSHTWLKNFYQYTKKVSPDSFTVAEVWNPDSIAAPYVQWQRVDLVFEFDLATALISSLQNNNPGPLQNVIRSGLTLYPAGQYGTFLTNHDMARVMTQLGGSFSKAKAGAALYLTLPGTPFIYYGEEIGMTGEAPDEMGRRPMQWTSGANTGFSTGKPWTPPDSNSSTINVQTQAAEPGSLLAYYQTLIQLRKHHPSLHSPYMQTIPESPDGSLAYLRVSKEEAILVLANLSVAPISNYALSVPSSAIPSGHYLTHSLLGTAPEKELIVDEIGGFSGFTPMTSLPADSILVILLAPQQSD
jgi:alpha-amylase